MKERGFDIGKRCKVFLLALAFLMMLTVGLLKPISASAESVTVTTDDMVLDMVSEINATGSSGLVDKGDYSYKISYGDYTETVGEISDFTISNSGTDLRSSEVYGNNDYNKVYIGINHLIRVCVDYSIIYTIEAHADMMITIGNEEATADSTSNTAVVTSYVNDTNFDVEQYTISVPSSTSSVKINEDECLHTVYLQAGDTLNTVISTPTGDGKSFTGFYLNFEIDKDAYDESLRFDFSGYSDFKDEVELKKIEIEEIYSELEKSLYTLTAQLNLVSIRDSALTAIDSLSMDYSLEEFINEYRADLADVLTISQEADELLQAQTTYSDLLDEKIASLSSFNYSFSAWSEINTIVEETKTTINSLTTTSGVLSKYTSAIKLIEEVATSNQKLIILLCSIGGVLIVGGIVTLIIFKNKKNKVSNKLED